MAQNPSSFAGQWNATAYAFGAPGGPPPLILGHPTKVGVAVPSVQFGFTTLIDGTQLYPLNTNAPIRVGNAIAENVTPSDVSAVGPAYRAMNFTASFSDAHGVGDPISSATFGLQEAINAADAAGGGSVIIDSAWAALGGTTGIRNAATLPAGVTILDYRTGFNGGSSSGITIDSTVISGGSDGQLLYEAGGAVSESADLAWDPLNGLQSTARAAANYSAFQAGYFKADANGHTISGAGIGVTIDSPSLNGGSIGTPVGLSIRPQGATGFAIQTDTGKNFFTDTVIMARATVPADGDLAAGQMALWLDPTDGAAKLMIKAKSANGTVRTGSVNLS